jgi:uncharacterized heparinase superfamily protein
MVRRLAMVMPGPAPRRPWAGPWSAPLVMPRCQLERGVFDFLGERGCVDGPSAWNAAGRSKLWLYNLHYLDDLNAMGADERADLEEWLIQRWIDDNPPSVGNGWEPYPLSLRLVNLVKWCARQPFVPAAWIASMGKQAQALAVQEERHILANHLFANGKALTFMGTFLDGDQGERWLERGLRILDREVDEQFLSDGGHFELSPMYHSILLWDLCDLVNLAEASGVRQLGDRSASWREVIKRGLAWLALMSHPDGEVAFFNDCAFGIAPHPARVRAYAETLGCPVRPLATGLLSATHLPDSGYVVIGLGEGGKAILDIAEVGPRYQPGHAHADTLSFELSLYGQRVLVNSGTSCYGTDAERQRQRGTAAHNTVEVDGQDSSEVWAGFRVARRARPGPVEIRSVSAADGDSLLVRCSHDGYRRLRGSPVHQRQWRLFPQRLSVTDTLTGRFREAVSRYYLHPEVRLGANQELRLPGGEWIRWSVAGGEPRVVDSTWHPRFGASVPNRCIEVRFVSNELTVEFFWS